MWESDTTPDSGFNSYHTCRINTFYLLNHILVYISSVREKRYLPRVTNGLGNDVACAISFKRWSFKDEKLFVSSRALITSVIGFMILTTSLSFSCSTLSYLCTPLYHTFMTSNEILIFFVFTVSAEHKLFRRRGRRSSWTRSSGSLLSRYVSEEIILVRIWNWSRQRIFLASQVFL